MGATMGGCLPVTGPAGEEIFTDKYGRIKVQFHWDREGQHDASSSCWVRVATHWAGKQWGAIHIPRIGQEVVVDFEEGDVNHPIVVGSVYNADLMPPYSLPDNKTQSGIKSRSSKNGGPDNCNEIRFEDKKDSEQIFVHAEKDMLTEVEHDETRTVDHDRTTTIKNNETKTVTEGNETITIKQGNQSNTVEMGDQSNQVKTGNVTHTIDMGNLSTTVKMGNITNKVNLGKTEEEAMQSIELKVGQSSIKIDQMGVTIKGMMIKVEGQVQVQIKGLMTQVNGDAMLTCKGGITMIN
ncbi:MAG: type VI secretion system tip protein VgrG [Acidobacteriia bacterium]|nr:type VI secretion system tip protein VgrG [Terriglobia bacterium]